VDLEETREYRILRGIFRMMKIINIPLESGSVIGFAVISFQDYSAVCIGTTGVNGDGIGHIRLCEYDKAENKDPITRILYDVFQDLKSCGDPIPLYMFGHLAGGDYSVEKYINQGLSEEKIDELVDWFDKWWSEFERKHNEESSHWEGIFGVLDWFEKFDEFA